MHSRRSSWRLHAKVTARRRPIARWASGQSALRCGRSWSSRRRPPLDEWRARPRRRQSLRTYINETIVGVGEKRWSSHRASPLGSRVGRRDELRHDVARRTEGPSSRVARYSSTTRLAVSAAHVFFHYEPGIERCLLASAAIRLASTANPSPPTSKKSEAKPKAPTRFSPGPFRVRLPGLSRPRILPAGFIAPFWDYFE